MEGKKGVISPKLFWNPEGCFIRFQVLGNKHLCLKAPASGCEVPPSGVIFFFLKSTTCLQVSSLSLHDVKFKF